MRIQNELMRDGGELRVASDDPSYQEWILAHMSDLPEFQWLARGPRDWRERPDDWPATRYEQKAVEAGRIPLFLRYERLPRA